jgi:nitroreductase
LLKTLIYDKIWLGDIMNFTEIAKNRYSCRAYDGNKSVEDEKIKAILESAVLSPSACNSQPYHFTVCKGEKAKEVAKATQSMGMNKFTADAPVMIVISEENYNRTAGIGSKLKNNDYRSIDIGIATAYLTAEAAAQGLGTCILGWFDDKKIRQICGLKTPVRLVISLGYAKEGGSVPPKKRKPYDELVGEV